MDFNFLLILAVILLSTKVFGVLSQKIHMPQVVGALIAGIVLGPSILGVLNETDFIKQTAEIGVILLMFLAGIDTDLEELKKNGLKSAVVALIGIVVPVGVGAIAYYFFYQDSAQDPMFWLRAIFVGIVITSTSVSITVETLREMGKLKGKVGTTILGAAIIDDIIGIILLSITTSVTGSEVSISTILLKIVLFFVFILVLAVVLKHMKKFIEKENGKRRTSIYALAFCFVMAYLSEHIFGIADITGAYFAGLLLCQLVGKEYIGRKVNILSYLIFSPIFFVSIGLKTSLDNFTKHLFIFTVVFVIIAIATKIIGCFIGSKLCKFDNMTSLCIGVGMVSRGEVTLIGAQKGFEAGILDGALFPAIVLVVVATDLLTPIMLKFVLNRRDKMIAEAKIKE